MRQACRSRGFTPAVPSAQTVYPRYVPSLTPHCFQFLLQCPLLQTPVLTTPVNTSNLLFQCHIPNTFNSVLIPHQLLLTQYQVIYLLCLLLSIPSPPFLLLKCKAREGTEHDCSSSSYTAAVPTPVGARQQMSWGRGRGAGRVCAVTGPRLSILGPLGPTRASSIQI